MTADVELLPLPEPYGYLRDMDGGLQMSIGPVRPADRAGGYATPWVAMYDPGRVRANVAHATAARDAEVEALRADAERYRAMRDELLWSMVSDTERTVLTLHMPGVSLAAINPNSDEFDAAIDAARAATSAEGMGEAVSAATRY